MRWPEPAVSPTWYLECTVVHTGYHPLRNGDPFLPPTAPIGTGTDTSTSRYQTTSLLASGASTELLLEQSTWVARARGRATFEGSFRRHEAGCRFVHFCEQTFAPHSVVSAFLRRLVLFASCFRCRPSRVRRLPHLEPPVSRLDRTVRPPLRRRRLRVATLPVGLAPLPLGSRLRPQVPWPRPVPLPPWSAPMTWPGSHR